MSSSRCITTGNRRALCGTRSSVVAACLCVAPVVAACDQSFEPIAPSELAFSVFGYLDASADTQWVRVLPIRPLAVTSRDELGVTVTLEHLGTGRIVELRDSLFKFSLYADPDLGSEGAYAHNFWTLEKIEPGATYRFSARQEGQEPAEAVVEIPLDYEVEVAIDQFPTSRGASDSLWITGLKHLPFLTASAHFYDGCEPSGITVRYPGHSADDGNFQIAITKPQVTPRTGCGRPWVANRELWMAGSEAAWPDAGYSAGALGGSGRTSNVTNAVGFLGGVLTKVIPYENCTFQTGGVGLPDYCRLRYNPETATVTGTVRETLCGDGPLDSVTVQLTELGPNPARIRTVLTTRAGEFVIGALEPGIPHFLKARAPLIPVDSIFDLRTFSYVYTEWADVHTIPTDTLTFTPGQRVAYDIDLERLTPCSEPPPMAR